MFRALTCPSSGGHIVLSQHLVSSLSVNGCTERRLRADCQLNAQFLYSVTICMLHYNPRYVSSINMPIFRRTYFIITASGIVTLCKRLYSMPDCSLLSSGVLYSRLQRVTIPDAKIIQFVLLKMGMLMIETCRGL